MGPIRDLNSLGFEHGTELGDRNDFQGPSTGLDLLSGSGEQQAHTPFSKRNATFLKLCFFWRRVYTNESGVMHDPRLHDPDPGPQEKSTEKSCVSFGKDCNRVCDIRMTRIKTIDSFFIFLSLFLGGGARAKIFVVSFT